MKYLLDTNICIFAIKNRPKTVIDKIQTHLKDGIVLSSLTIAELEFGVENSQHIDKNRLALMKFLSPFEIISFDDSDAIPYGRIKTHLRKQGLIIGPIDLLLAAQCLARGLCLVSNNTSEFERIPELILADWSK